MAKTSKDKSKKPADLARKAAPVSGPMPPPKKGGASSLAIEAARRLMQGGKMDPSK